jgi:aminoglycoside phosphotransferase (APT) family kinase protein
VAWPGAEVSVEADLARELLRSQHPDLAGEPIELVDAGFDNFIFRLGSHRALRMPRREPAAALIEHEQRWMVHLPDLPLEVPAPERLGRPGHGYPWHWSVVPWIEGEAADRRPPDDGARTASGLGLFLRALHRPAPAGLPLNPYRSGPLVSRAEAFEDRLNRLKEHLDVAAARAAWAQALGAADHQGPKVWLHGDLHPANLLVRHGTVHAVIDFGDTCAGDPACDLGALYLTVPAEHRHELEVAYGAADEQAKRRALGWTLFFAVMLLEIGLAQRPTYAVVARRALVGMGVSPGASD